MKILMAAGVGALLFATQGVAHHAEYLDIPYDTRGECEAEIAQLRNGDRDFLQQVGPQYFRNPGDVNAFLSRAFSCDLDEGDGAWYITDHRVEVLSSDWFRKRQR